MMNMVEAEVAAEEALGAGRTKPDDNNPLKPCEETKEQLQDEEFKEKITTLEAYVDNNDTSEHGFTYEAILDDNRNIIGYKYVPMPTIRSGFSVEIHVHQRNSIGYLHSHAISKDEEAYKTIQIFSPKDLYQFLRIVHNTRYNNIPLSKIYGMMTGSLGTYLLRFTGDVNSIEACMNRIGSEKGRMSFDYLDKEYKKLINDYDEEAGFLHLISDIFGVQGVELQKIESDDMVKTISLDTSKRPKEQAISKDC